MVDPLAALDVALIRADNPSPLTLTGTNTWVTGRDPCWVIDPGPALEDHLDAVTHEIGRRGGAGGIAVTHDHLDHAAATEGLRARLGGGVVVGAARMAAAIALGDGDVFGPLRVIASPGHAPDHLAFECNGVLFTGDAVLGEGTAFLFPVPGALNDYLRTLTRLRDVAARIICPGHGPVITDPTGRIEGYLAHRRDRERRLVAALAAGRRTVDELLDVAWDDVADSLRPVAAVTLATHLDKLEQEGRLPDGVERPVFPGADG